MLFLLHESICMYTLFCISFTEVNTAFSHFLLADCVHVNDLAVVPTQFSFTLSVHYRAC